MRDLEDVDRVLAGLRAAKPGAGLQERVLLALAQPEPLNGLEEGNRPGFRQLRFLRSISRPRLVACVTAAVLLLLSPAAVHMLRRGAKRPSAAGLTLGRVVAPALPRASLPRASMPRASMQRASMPRAVEPRVQAAISAPHSGRSTRSAPVTLPSESGGDLAELTVKDAPWKSFPAPPMPLTRQERLLLRMLHGGETGELVAALSANAERAVEAQDGAHRLQFFTPVRPIQQVEKDNAEQPGIDAVGHMGPVAATPDDSKEKHAE